MGEPVEGIAVTRLILSPPADAAAGLLTLAWR